MCLTVDVRVSRKGLIDDQGSMHNYHSMDPREEEPGGYGDAGPDQFHLRDDPQHRFKYQDSAGQEGGVGGVIFAFVLQHSYILTLIVMMVYDLLLAVYVTLSYVTLSYHMSRYHVCHIIILYVTLSCMSCFNIRCYVVISYVMLSYRMSHYHIICHVISYHM